MSFCFFKNTDPLFVQTFSILLSDFFEKNLKSSIFATRNRKNDNEIRNPT